MEQDTLPVEVILSHPRQSLGNVRLDWTPQPGNYLDLARQQGIPTPYRFGWCGMKGW